jgi:hypothetical protein
MWYKVNKRLIWTQQVRPSEITETYTIAKFWNNTSWASRNQSIYKSWYKVKKIEIDSTVSAWSSTSYWTISLFVRPSNNPGGWYWAYICFNGSIWDYVYTLWSQYDYTQWPTSPIFWFTTAHCEITSDYAKLSNGTWTINQTHNYSSSSKTSIETLFSQSNIQIYLEAIYPYLWPTTIKVTYTPN